MNCKFRESTCYVGRYYPRKNRPQDFFTLHQLAGKCLFAQYGWGNFKGLEMCQLIEIALHKVLEETASHETIVFYSDLIRLHKSKALSVNDFPNGKEVLRHYEALLDSNYDFEDALQHASWILKNTSLTQLHRFRFKNIVLLEPENLDRPNNRNALEFFNSFSTWASSKGVRVFIQKSNCQIERYYLEEARANI